MQKSHFIGISIVLSVVVICGYSYDVYRANKLLDLKLFEARQLAGDANHLKMYKLIRHAINNDEIEMFNAILNDHITNQEESIKSRMAEATLDEKQLQSIKKSLHYDDIIGDDET